MSYDFAQCENYDRGTCRSCSIFGITPNQRHAHKTSDLLRRCSAAAISSELIAPLWTPKDLLASRFKVKAVIGGTVTEPIIGFIDDSRTVRHLVDCPLLHPQLNALLTLLVNLIREFKLTPYDIETRRGELKYIIAILDPTGNFGIVRFVTRSTECHPRIEKAVTKIQSALPWITVVSTNIQPEPAAILEGPLERVLTDAVDIPFTLGTFSIVVGPQSFVQVTPETATALYAAVRSIVADKEPSRVLDLYCGVGGFAFACAPYATTVHGIELSENAIDCAIKGARLNGFTNCSFESGDVVSHENFISTFEPDLVVVNPPRGGLKPTLLELLKSTGSRTIVYSSCNPSTLFRDLGMLLPTYEVQSVRPFDMFPCTDHLEVLTVLRKR